MRNLVFQTILFVFAATFTAAQSTNNVRKVFRDRIEPHWFAGDSKFWYRLDLSEDRKEFIMVDAEKGERAPAFDHQRVADILSKHLGKAVDPERLPFEKIEYSKDERSIHLLGEQNWKLELDAYSASELKIEAPEAENTAREEPRRERSRERGSAQSPDEKREILLRGHNLFLKNRFSTEVRQITHDGNPNHTYARNAQRARFVEMRYDAREDEIPAPEIYWAPDSSRFIAMRVRPGTERIVHLVESSPEDQLQPKLQSYPYAKPGDEIPMRKPHLFEVGTLSEIPIDDELFENPWSINDFRWAKDSSRFTFLFNQRGHQVLRIIAVDSRTGECSTLVNDESKTFVNYSGKFFCNYLEDTEEIIWMSERDGWNHLYLYDARAGKVKHQITKGEWVVRRVDRVDPQKRQIWFEAGGIRPGQDPYYIHHCRVDFDGDNLTVLTEGDGTHSVQFSEDRRFIIDTWSRVDQAPRIDLRRSKDGTRLCELENADIRKLVESGWEPPERFTAKGRDGNSDIYGIIHRPPGYDSKKKYPVLESIYAGPHDSFVPKGFRSSHGAEKLTRLGFIVVQIDGMGTSNRSKKFHDVCWKNIADAGLPDRILWIKAAAEKYPEFDLNRVGIYGTSAGAQSALGALLMHGDFYKAAVADCGCHDNRMDKIWWNEQWMGWPVGKHYEEQSNVTMAHRLQGQLLLMVGELDRNVDPASTMQVVHSLVKANKDFELLVLPGAGHGVARTPYGWRRIEEFFTRHFQNRFEPSADSQVARSE